MGGTLLDPVLALAADVVGDLETVRIANANRLATLTRTGPDKDGVERGWGLDERHPAVAALAAIVDQLAKVEDVAVKHLRKVMTKHPLGPWQKAQTGIGEKQFARLIAAVGDPYWRPELVREVDGVEVVEPARPRTVSELWAYCGLHTIGGYAARRMKGVRANWSAAAKMRAYLVAEKAVQCGKADDTLWYQVYAGRKAATVGRLHGRECVRCGPAGRPAAEGTPWSDGHRHADALRILSKAILREVWREAKRLHELPAGGHAPDVAQPPIAAGRGQTRPGQDQTDTHPNLARATNSPTGHGSYDAQTRIAGRGQLSPRQTTVDTHGPRARGDQSLGETA
jgi:hypothetical protein